MADACSEAAATDARQLLRGFGGLRQRAGGRFQFGRGRRHGVDDAADRRLELVGELVHRRLRSAATCSSAALCCAASRSSTPPAPRSAAPFACFALLRLVLRLLDRLDLERLDRLAISPISSRRPSPGRTTSSLPPASSRMAAVMACIALATPRAISDRDDGDDQQHHEPVIISAPLVAAQVWASRSSI